MVAVQSTIWALVKGKIWGRGGGKRHWHQGSSHYYNLLTKNPINLCTFQQGGFGSIQPFA